MDSSSHHCRGKCVRRSQGTAFVFARWDLPTLSLNALEKLPMILQMGFVAGGHLVELSGQVSQCSDCLSEKVVLHLRILPGGGGRLRMLARSLV